MQFRSPGSHNRTHLPGDSAKYLFIKHCRLSDIDPFTQMIMDCRDAYPSGDDLYYTFLSDEEDENYTSDEDEEKDLLFSRIQDLDKAIEDGYVSIRRK